MNERARYMPCLLGINNPQRERLMDLAAAQLTVKETLNLLFPELVYQHDF
jgi:hypothetical protein